MSRFLILPGLLAVLMVSACSAPHDDAVQAVIRPVLTAVATAVSGEKIGPFVGTVQARQQTAMGFLLAGRVLTRDVAVGDLVQPGQLLATLDSSVQEFQLSAAQANLASATAQFNNLAQSEARIAQLVSTNTAAQAQLDAAATARQTAQAQLDQARSNVDRAQDQLDYTRLVADAAGVVVSTAAEVGQVVTVGEPVVVIAQPDTREAVFDLPAGLVAGLKVGDAIEVSAASDQIAPASGVIGEIATSASSTARLRRVHVTLEGVDDGYRLGTTVEAIFERPYAAAVIPVPATALRGEGATTSVWIADAKTGTVSSRAVVTGARTDATVVIAEGIKEGEIVVTAGVHSLTEGQSVLISQGIAE